jgi:hypothetical protein
MSLFQFWESDTDESSSNEFQEPGASGLIDCIICSIITIVRLLLGYFPAPFHPHILANNTDYTDIYDAADVD